MESRAFDKKALDYVKERCLAAYPNECCGVLIGAENDSRVVEALEIHNVTEKSKANVFFQIDALGLYALEKELERKKQKIIGVYHSHPDCPAVFSDEDERGAIPELTYLVVSVANGRLQDVKCYIKSGLHLNSNEIDILVR